MAAFARETRGLVSATLFLDPRKFYEHSSHAELLAAAEQVAFLKALIRAYCTVYRSPRRVPRQGAISRVIKPNGSVIAGCSGATSLARLLLVSVLRRVASTCPTVTLKSVIDETSFQSIGGQATASAELSTAFNLVTQGLQARGAPLAWNKLGLLASPPSLAKQLAAEMSAARSCSGSGPPRPWWRCDGRR
eukprot:9503942-Pyramimonas_sp.AAC.2